VKVYVAAVEALRKRHDEIQEFLVINLLVFPFLKIASQKHLGVFSPPKTNSK
jgi:nitrate reductase NapE component